MNRIPWHVAVYAFLALAFAGLLPSLATPVLSSRWEIVGANTHSTAAGGLVPPRVAFLLPA